MMSNFWEKPEPQDRSGDCRNFLNPRACVWRYRGDIPWTFFSDLDYAFIRMQNTEEPELERIFFVVLGVGGLFMSNLFYVIMLRYAKNFSAGHDHVPRTTSPYDVERLDFGLSIVYLSTCMLDR